MSVFDLSKKYKFTKDVNNNMKYLNTKLGNKFTLLNEGKVIAVKIMEQTFPNDMQFYEMECTDYDRNGKSPFIMTFIDAETLKKNDSVYINQISKNDELTGTFIMETLIKFFKIINVKKVTLVDGATVNCNANRTIDLSLYKLITLGRTFYMKFGFDYYPEASNNIYFRHPSAKDTKAAVNRLLTELETIKIKDVIAYYTAASKAVESGAKMLCRHKHTLIPSDSFYYSYKPDVKKKRYEYLIKVLLPYADKSLREFLKTSDCESYAEFLQDTVYDIDIVDTFFVDNKEIKCSFNLPLSKLENIKSVCVYILLL